MCGFNYVLLRADDMDPLKADGPGDINESVYDNPGGRRGQCSVLTDFER